MLGGVKDKGAAFHEVPISLRTGVISITWKLLTEVIHDNVKMLCLKNKNCVNFIKKCFILLSTEGCLANKRDLRAIYLSGTQVTGPV